MIEQVKLALKAGEDFKYHEHDNGLKYYRHDYFEKHENLELSPQSYLIKQLPNITNPLHFHTQNQFQVFIAGSGHFGRHAVKPYVVHYAGAYTGYGPITAGEQGIDYLTLRSSRDLGAQFLPQQIQSLKRGPKHHYTSPSIEEVPQDELDQLEQIHLQWIHQEVQSGLGVSVLKLPKNETYLFPIPQNIAGIFMIVMQGSLIEGDQCLRKNENLYIGRDVKSHSLQTDNQAAQILILHIPLKDPSYQVTSK
jgi:hypothetical protein